MYPVGFQGSGNVVVLCATNASNTATNWTSETLSRVKLPFPARVLDCWFQTGTPTATTTSGIKVWPAIQNAAGAHVMSAGSLAVTVTTTAVQGGQFGELSAVGYPSGYCVALKQCGAKGTGTTLGETQFFVAVEPMLTAG